MAAERRARPEPLSVLRTLGSESRVPEGAGDRVRTRLAATLLSPAGLDPFTSPPPAPPAPPQGTSVAAPSGSGALGALWQSAAGKVVILGLTAAVGAGLHALLSRPVTKVIYTERPPAAVIAPPSPPTVASALVEVTPVPSASAPPSVSAPDSASRQALLRAQSLKEERAVLDAVRRSLSNGDATAALARLSQYERSFPRAKLAEERDALRVNALVIAGNHAEARRRAAAFRRDYPQSFLMPSIDAALAAMPSE